MRVEPEIIANPPAFIGNLEHRGYGLIPRLISDSTAVALAGVVAYETIENHRRGGSRNILPIMREFAKSSDLDSVMQAVMGPGAFAVRALVFNKTPAANWLVPWHQDLTICVRERKSVPGYGPWTTKAAINHVQPPTAILERMVAVRIHLDDSDETAGCLRILPGTHKHGRISADQIAAAAATIEAQTYPLARGGAFLIKPLLLHSSQKATHPSHRRVIHIEYANFELDGGLEWLRE